MTQRHQYSVINHHCIASPPNQIANLAMCTAVSIDTCTAVARFPRPPLSNPIILRLLTSLGIYIAEQQLSQVTFKITQIEHILSRISVALAAYNPPLDSDISPCTPCRVSNP